MLAFEVYGKREVRYNFTWWSLLTAWKDLYETHFNSAAMGGFLKKIAPTMTTGLDLAHYGYVGGYLDKPGDSRECKIMQDTRIIAISSEARKTIASKLAQLAKSVKASEDGIYTWMAFVSHDDDVSLRIYIRFATRAAMEKYQARKDVLDFWSGSKEEVKQMEWRCYLPNSTPQKKKGWLHR
jgi:quinol monooxygenase YgiN